MTWQDFPYRRIAEEVCTPKEIAALRLVASGLSQRATARALGATRGAIRSRIESAAVKIRRHPDYPGEAG